MGKGDLQDDVRELRKQVEALREALATVAEPYREIAGYMEQLQTIARGYFRLLDHAGVFVAQGVRQVHLDLLPPNAFHDM